MTEAPLWRAGAIMLVSMTFIVGGDTAGKLLTQDGFEPVYIAWTRFALAAVVMLPFCAVTRDDVVALRDPKVWLRAVLIMACISCILTALRTEPIANAFGAFFIGPIVAYVLSVVFLKERVSVLRTCLLGLSFIGVLMVVKPGFGATIGMGFAVLAGVFYGGYIVTTRWIAPLYRPRLLLISQLGLGAVLLAPFGLAAQPEAISSNGFGLIVISALASAFANLLLVTLSKTTPSSIIAPLIYTQLIAATFFGYFVFSDWPDWLSFVGLALICATGLGSLMIPRR